MAGVKPLTLAPAGGNLQAGHDEHAGDDRGERPGRRWGGG